MQEQVEQGKKEVSEVPVSFAKLKGTVCQKQTTKKCNNRDKDLNSSQNKKELQKDYDEYNT